MRSSNFIAASLAALVLIGVAPQTGAALNKIAADVSATVTADAAEIEALIGRLGSVDPAERDRAGRRLEDIGVPALELLKTAACEEEPEVRGRAQRLVNEIDRRRWLVRTLNGHEDIVWAVAFSPNGRFLLTAGGANFTRGPRFGGEGGGHDADFVAVGWEPGADFAIRIRDADSGRELRRLEGHTRMVTTAVWSADGRWIASCGDDNTVRLWDAVTGKQLRAILGHNAGVWSVAFTSDGRRLVSGARDGSVRLWDAETGKELRRFNCGRRVWAVAAQPNGKLVVCGGDDGQIRLWNLEPGAELKPLQGHGGTVAALAFSPDGKQLASGGWDGTVRIWEIETGKNLHILKGHDRHVEGVSWSPDGKWVLSGALDKTVRLWDAQVGVELRRYEGHVAPATKVAFSPDGRCAVSGGWDKTARVWLMPEIQKPDAGK